MTRPIFPLSALVFPDGLLPLRIFEARYLDMVARCLREDQGFVVTLARSGEEADSQGEIFRVGTQVRIIDWDRNPDGLLGIVVQGEARVRILTHDYQTDRLMVGEVESLPTPPAQPLPAARNHLAQLAERVIEQLGELYQDRGTPQYGDAAWVADRLGEWLPMPAEMRQRLLEADDPLWRLATVDDWLRRLPATLDTG